MPALHDVQCYTPWLVMSITTGCSHRSLSLPVGAKPKAIIVVWRRDAALSLKGFSREPTVYNGAELLTESWRLLDLLDSPGSQVGGAPEVYVGQLLRGFFRVDQNERPDALCLGIWHRHLVAAH